MVSDDGIAAAAPGGVEGHMANEAQVAIRLPTDFLKRAGVLVAAMKKSPAMQAWSLTRSSVLRLAVQRGLDVLEAEYAPKRRRPR